MMAAPTTNRSVSCNAGPSFGVFGAPCRCASFGGIISGRFHMSGRATSSVPRRSSACIAEALEPRRLFDAGLLDVQFNPVGGGAAVTNFRNANENGRAVLPMSDGRVIVVGEYRGTGTSAVNDWGGFALVRHNADGSYDPSFGPGGSVRTRGPAGLLPIVVDALLQP